MKGKICLFCSTSSGGYGNPLERKPEEVLEDVLDELISRETAQNVYGVVVTPTGSLELQATQNLRKELINK